jgi:hypothetical protein
VPRYLLRYRVQTCLTRNEDVELTFNGHRAVFLFGQKSANDTAVLVQIELDSTNNREAQILAASFLLPQILDSLSFSTGTPLLLEHCELVLKDETGSHRRRVIHVAKRNVPSPVELNPESHLEAQALLGRSEHLSLSLCWYRYALYRQLALDRFLFQWLGFESLAGDKEIQVPCTNCGHVNSHSGSNKEKAYELYASAAPGTSRQRFNRDIWGAMRNAVFHGNKYPVPAFLAELVPVNETLRRACETEISSRAQLGERPRARRNLETIYYFYNFIEWTTTETESAFALDFPAKALSAMVEHGLSRSVGTNFPESSGYSVLTYEPDSREW